MPLIDNIALAWSPYLHVHGLHLGLHLGLVEPNRSPATKKHAGDVACTAIRTHARRLWHGQARAERVGGDEPEHGGPGAAAAGAALRRARRDAAQRRGALPVRQPLLLWRAHSVVPALQHCPGSCPWPAVCMRALVSAPDCPSSLGNAALERLAACRLRARWAARTRPSSWGGASRLPPGAGATPSCTSSASARPSWRSATARRRWLSLAYRLLHAPHTQRASS